MKRLFSALLGLGIALALLLSPHGFSPARSVPTALAQTPAMAESGRLTSEKFDSIIVDFSESPEALAQLPTAIAALSSQFNLKPVLNSAFSQADHIYILPGDASVLSTLQASALAAQTEFIEPNYLYAQTGLAVNDPEYAKQWNLKQIRVEGAWKAGAKGQGVTVAVIDTGISQGPDLKQTPFVEGYDFVNDRTDASDDNGHGTHVAGTIAQSTNNKYGVAGVAYKARLMPLKVLSRAGFGTVADIAEAIRFAADHGADVVNMSLGGGGESKLMKEAIEYAHSKGVVIIAAAGNSGMNQAAYPARYDKVIGVAAIGPDEKKTPYSNYGEGVDIAAPGGDTRAGEANGVLQETIDPRSPGSFQFKAFQGTSMASPHVAGVAALIKSRGRFLSANRIEQILLTSARSVTGDSNRDYGAGYLDAEKAIRMANWLWWDWRGVAWKEMAIKLALALALTWLIAPRARQFNPWNLGLGLGIVSGSMGLFFLRALHVSFIPHWPLELLGTAVPAWGQVIWNTSTLNPFFASLLIPFGLMTLFISHRYLRWIALGLSIGMMAYMGVAAFSHSTVWLIGTGWIAQIYLLANVAIGGLLTQLYFQVVREDGNA